MVEVVPTCAACAEPVAGFKIRGGKGKGQPSAYCEACVNEFESDRQHELDEEPR